MTETWSPAVPCPSCGGRGHFEIPASEAIYCDGEVVIPENGDMCLICEDCERTGVVTAVFAASLLARADQIVMRAMAEHDPDAARTLMVSAQRLEEQLGLAPYADDEWPG